MGKHTVRAALHTYRTSDGKSRMARRGDEIELDGDELERAQRLGAITDEEIEPPAGPVREPLPPIDPADAGALPGDEQVERPTASDSKGTWVAYAVSQGMPEAEAQKLSRNQLAERYAAE